MTKALRLNVQSGAAKLKPRRAFAVFAIEADGRRHVYYHPQDGCQTYTTLQQAKREASRLSLQHLSPLFCGADTPAGAASIKVPGAAEPCLVTYGLPTWSMSAF